MYPAVTNGISRSGSIKVTESECSNLAARHGSGHLSSDDGRVLTFRKSSDGENRRSCKYPGKVQ